MVGSMTNDLISKTIDAIEIHSESDLTIETNTQIRLNTPNLLINFIPFDLFIRNVVFKELISYTYDKNSANLTNRMSMSEINLTDSFDGNDCYECDNVYCYDINANKSELIIDSTSKYHCVTLSASNKLYLSNLASSTNIEYNQSDSSESSLSNYIYSVINEIGFVNENVLHNNNVIVSARSHDITNFGSFHTNKIITTSVKTSSLVYVDGDKEPIMDISSKSAINMHIYDVSDTTTIGNNIYLGDSTNLTDYIYSLLHEPVGDFSISLSAVNGIDIQVYFNKNDTNQGFTHLLSQRFTHFTYKVTFNIYLQSDSVEDYNKITQSPERTQDNVTHGKTTDIIGNITTHTMTNLTPGAEYKVYLDFYNNFTKTTTLNVPGKENIFTIPFITNLSVTISNMIATIGFKLHNVYISSISTLCEFHLYIDGVLQTSLSIYQYFNNNADKNKSSTATFQLPAGYVTGASLTFLIKSVHTDFTISNQPTVAQSVQESTGTIENSNRTYIIMNNNTTIRVFGKSKIVLNTDYHTIDGIFNSQSLGSKVSVYNGEFYFNYSPGGVLPLGPYSTFVFTYTSYFGNNISHTLSPFTLTKPVVTLTGVLTNDTLITLTASYSGGDGIVTAYQYNGTDISSANTLTDLGYLSQTEYTFSVSGSCIGGSTSLVNWYITPSFGNPGVPTGLLITITSPNRITCSWGVPSSFGNGTITKPITYSFQLITDSVSGTVLSLSNREVSNIATSKTSSYTFKVFAVVHGTSSTVQSSTLRFPNETISISVGSISHNSITISWSIANPFTPNAYFVSPQIKIEVDATTYTLPASSSSFTILGLQPSTSYTINVSKMFNTTYTSTTSSVTESTIIDMTSLELVIYFQNPFSGTTNTPTFITMKALSSDTIAFGLAVRCLVDTNEDFCIMYRQSTHTIYDSTYTDFNMQMFKSKEINDIISYYYGTDYTEGQHVEGLGFYFNNKNIFTFGDIVCHIKDSTTLRTILYLCLTQAVIIKYLQSEVDNIVNPYSLKSPSHGNRYLDAPLIDATVILNDTTNDYYFYTTNIAFKLHDNLKSQYVGIKVKSGYHTQTKEEHAFGVIQPSSGGPHVWNQSTATSAEYKKDATTISGEFYMLVRGIQLTRISNISIKIDTTTYTYRSADIILNLREKLNRIRYHSRGMYGKFGDIYADIPNRPNNTDIFNLYNAGDLNTSFTVFNTINVNNSNLEYIDTIGSHTITQNPT